MKLISASGTLGLVALATIVSPYAMADDTAGWYMGGNVGQSRATVDDHRIINGLLIDGFTTTAISHDEHDLGYKLFAGYQFNKNFALESGYFDLGQFGFTAATQPTGTLSGNMKLRGINLDAVGILPITDKFSAIGRIGVNYAETRDSFTSTGAVHVLDPNPSKRDTNYKFGVGLQYAFSESLAMRAEAERYRINDAVGNRGDIDLISLGLIYRFGKHAPAPVPEVVATAPAPEPVVAPQPAPAPAPRFEKYTLSSTELFAFDSAELKMPQPKLDEIANALNTHSEINDVDITGYSDRIGTDKYNQKLSEQRAIAVKSYLVSKGVDGNRMKAEGKGKANPVVVCTDKKRSALINCLEPNRRVEVEQITVVTRVK